MSMATGTPAWWLTVYGDTKAVPSSWPTGVHSNPTASRTCNTADATVPAANARGTSHDSSKLPFTEHWPTPAATPLTEYSNLYDADPKYKNRPP